VLQFQIQIQIQIQNQVQFQVHIHIQIHILIDIQIQIKFQIQIHFQFIFKFKFLHDLEMRAIYTNPKTRFQFPTLTHVTCATLRLKNSTIVISFIFIVTLRHI